MKANSIDRVVVSKTNPHNNNALLIDTSNGEKNAVLKYKGNPLVGGSSGSSGGTGMNSIIVPEFFYDEDRVLHGGQAHYAKIPKTETMQFPFVIMMPIAYKAESNWPDYVIVRITGFLDDVNTNLLTYEKVGFSTIGDGYSTDEYIEVESEQEDFDFLKLSVGYD